MTRCLDNSYKYLIADELIRMKEEGATVFMVSHDLSFTARVMDMVSLLFDGRIACTQTTGEFFKENLFYRPVIDWFFISWDRDWNARSDEHKERVSPNEGMAKEAAGDKIVYTYVTEFK